ncbi:MAG: hypothetical protein GX410_01560 [Elusimicrobia bacterium]|nr:hypothetical protein [Elusimicrobiota bacterium]
MFKLNDIELDAESISDDFAAAIAKFEAPYKNGAALEPLGLRARSIKFRCYFLNERYAEHKNLLALIDSQTEPLELLHPAYGLLKGYVETTSVRHDDRLKTAEIDVTFTEHQAAPAPVVRLNPATQLGTVAQKLGLAAQLSAKVAALSSTVRNQVMGRLEDGIASFEGVMNTVTLPADALTASVSYATSAPGRLVQSVAQAVERYAVAYNALKTAPELFTAKLKAAGESLEAAFADFGAGQPGMSPDAAAVVSEIINFIIRTSTATQLGYDTSNIYASDQEARASAAAMEDASNLDASGNIVASAEPVDYMNVKQLEATLADVMRTMQDAVDVMRAADGYAEEIGLLQSATAELVRQVNDAKLEREKIIQVTVERPTHLFLVLQKHGLPYTMARRVLAINSIPDPNEVIGTINIYAR